MIKAKHCHALYFSHEVTLSADRQGRTQREKPLSFVFLNSFRLLVQACSLNLNVLVQSARLNQQRISFS
jgi:hypothetical protein